MFPILWALAAVFILVSSLEFPGICKITKSKVFEFVRFMAWVTLIRVGVAYLSGAHYKDPDPNSPMNTINLLFTLGVFWEDVFFTLPILIAEKMGASKVTKGMMIALSSMAFASGHIAYGFPWSLITLAYVPFVSYKYGRKHGLGTVMICHILYDVITLASVRYLMP